MMDGIAGGYMDAMQSLARTAQIQSETEIAQKKLPGDLEEQQATINLRRQQAAEAMQKVEMQRKAVQRGEQVEGVLKKLEYGDNIVQNQKNAARALGAAGFAPEAFKLWDDAAQAEDRLSQAEQRIRLGQKQEIEGRLAAVKGELPYITDQASLDAANMRLLEQGILTSPFGQKFDPDRVQRIRDNINVIDGKLTEGMRLDREERLRDSETRKDEDRIFREWLARQRLRQSAERLTRQEKAGKPIGAPKTADLKEATSYIDAQPGWKDLVAGMDPAEKTLAARELYDRAQHKLQANPALSREQAYGQAVVEMHSENYFGAETESGVLGMGAKKRLRYHPGGTGPRGAMPRIKSDAEFDALPSGTIFVGPDGIKRRKP